MKLFNIIADSAQYAVAIVLYSLLKRLPPEFDNLWAEVGANLVAAIVSALLALFLYNIFFGRPTVRVVWVVGMEAPANKRPELVNGTPGLVFRYVIEAETKVAKWIVRASESLPLEAVLSFNPSVNLKIRKQRWGTETRKAGTALTTRFKDGLSPGNGPDGEFSLDLKEARAISTPIDCELKLQPLVNGGVQIKKRKARLLAKLYKLDASIDGFVIKGEQSGSADQRSNLSQTVSG